MLAPFSIFIRNHVIYPCRVFIDCTLSDDIYLCSYDDHHQTRPLDNITLYSEWLAYESRLMIHICLSGSCAILGFIILF